MSAHRPNSNFIGCLAGKNTLCPVWLRLMTFLSERGTDFFRGSLILLMVAAQLLLQMQFQSHKASNHVTPARSSR